MMIREGYHNMGVLLGGFNAWREAGYPVEEGTEAAMAA